MRSRRTPAYVTPRFAFARHPAVDDRPRVSSGGKGHRRKYARRSS